MMIKVSEKKKIKKAEDNAVSAGKICIIHNGKFSWELVVDGQYICINGTFAVDYFAEHYRLLGYKVTISGDGSADFKKQMIKEA